MFQKGFLVLLLCVVSYTTVAQTAVIELFTSQGCSSCPPADALLAEVQEHYGDRVITLSYHVDYWDYIGWKDPFASKAFTQKQYEYATAFRTRNVYTPQVVINGNSHFTGSDRAKMTKAIHENTLQNQGEIIFTSVKREANKVWINYILNSLEQAHETTFALTIKERTTKINRGENRNRTLKNHHIVIDQFTMSAKQKGSVQLKIPYWVTSEDEISIVSYATERNVGIVSALSRKL